MNDLGNLPKNPLSNVVDVEIIDDEPKKKKKKKDDKKENHMKKIADELNDIYEVIQGVAGEMTTIDMGHKHEVKVEDDGSGKTISTLSVAGEKDGNLNDHVHEIVDGVIQDSMGHSHTFSDEG